MQNCGEVNQKLETSVIYIYIYMIILFKYCADLENEESFKDFGLYIYIYRVTLQDITELFTFFFFAIYIF